MKKEYDLKKMKRRKGPIKVATKEELKIPVSLRVDPMVMVDIKTEAYHLGIPYQTHINSILHQYTTGALIPTKTVELLKKLKDLL